MSTERTPPTAEQVAGIALSRCVTCGEPHAYRQVEDTPYYSWAADDGHPLRRAFDCSPEVASEVGQIVLAALRAADLLRPDTPPSAHYERFGSVLRSDAPMLRETPRYERITATNVDAPDENWEPVYRLAVASEETTDELIEQACAAAGLARGYVVVIQNIGEARWRAETGRGPSGDGPTPTAALRAALASQPKGDVKR